MAVEPKDLGLVSAYGAALEGGYTGTYDEYKEKMLDLLNLNLSSLGSVDLKTVATTGSYNDLNDKPKINSVELTGSLKRSQLGIPEFKSIIMRSTNRIVRSNKISQIIGFDNNNHFGVISNNGSMSTTFNGEYVRYDAKNPGDYFEVYSNYSSITMYDGLLFLGVSIRVTNDFVFFPAGGYNGSDYQYFKLVPMYLFGTFSNLSSEEFYPNVCGPGYCRVFRNRYSHGVSETYSIMNKEYPPLYSLDVEMQFRGCEIPIDERSFAKGEVLTFEGIFRSNAFYAEDKA